MEVAALASCLNTLLPRLWEHRKGRAKQKTEIDIDVRAIYAAISSLHAAYEDAKYEGAATGSKSVKELKERARKSSQEIYDSMQRFFMIKEDKDYASFALTTKAHLGELQALLVDLKKCAAKAPEKPEDPHVANPIDMRVAQQELRELVQLAHSRKSEGRRKVISIVGFGGLGKTQLANLVYEKDKEHPAPQDPSSSTLRASVTAAAKEPKEILREILKQLDSACKDEELNLNVVGKCLTECLGNKRVVPKANKGKDTAWQYHNSGLEKLPVDTQGKYDNLTLAQLGKRLAERLQEKRYFVVIDDMQCKEQWNSMNDAFPMDGNVDGTIIVTTTIKSVADACSSYNGYVYKLSPFDTEKSLDLFFKGREWVRAEVEDNVSDILKKCDGLPLAIVSISQDLKDKKALTSMDCRASCKELGVRLVNEEGGLTRLRWVLVNKYISLDGYNLRACLLYFCMYKHNMGAVPKRNSLIRRWEAERFLVENNTTRPTDVGAKNLETLVDHNIIQPILPGTNGAARRCRPRGMMLEYISELSMSENFSALVSEAMEKGNSHIRRLSFHAGSATDTDNEKISNMDLKIILTLAVSGDGLEAILDFKKYQLIAVLDLKECTNVNDDHVKDICKLVLLKYLSLGNKIGNIPEDISKLGLLETLEMRTTEKVEVHAQVLRLPNLKHLIGMFMLTEYQNLAEMIDSHFCGDVDLYTFLAERSVLETVTGFVTGTVQGFPKLMSNMMGVRKMKICCDSEAKANDMACLQTAIKKFIRRGTDTFSPVIEGADKKTGGRSSSLSMNFSNSNTSGDMWGAPLEFLQCDGSLESLKLCGPWGTFKVPTVTASAEQSQPILGPGTFTKISGITKLCLSHTGQTGEVVLASLAKMIALLHLKLEEDILGPLTIESKTLQSLVRLILVGETTPKTGETSPPGITIRPGALPCLLSLHLISEDPIFIAEVNQVKPRAADQSSKGKDKVKKVKQVQLPIPRSAGNQVQLPNGCLRCLDEIALSSRAQSNKVRAWKRAAKDHPNRPTVLLIPPIPTNA